MLAFDAMDPGITREMAADGRLPNFASLLRASATCPVRNPIGLFVGTLWSTFFTARSAARTGFHCWEEITPGSYERRVTTADSIRGTPFWETLSAAGRRVAVLDVPHSRAGTRLNGIQISEWGCHDRHFGLRSYPPELAEQLVERFGTHPVLGQDPWSVREWAPDDYIFRAGPLRSGEEEQQLLAGLLAGAETKSALSRSLLADGPWDLFLAVFGEPHSAGHQSWHVRDPAHPRHDPQLLRRIGDPLEQIYRVMDRALGEHLELIGEDATVLVLLSHGMGPHYDATHLLPEILRRLDTAYERGIDRSWQGRTLGGIWNAMPASARNGAGRVMARALSQRAEKRRLRPVRDGETEEERRAQLFFMSPNNFVVGGVRINLRGREREGRVAPGNQFDQLCERLTRDLLGLVNVETGAPVIRSVERTDRHYPREQLDALPDLLLEWNHERPISTIWSPRFGLMHGPYVHWRTGDHRPGGLLLARAPGLDPGARGDPIAIEDLGPTICARLGVKLEDVDGHAAQWLSEEPLSTR